MIRAALVPYSTKTYAIGVQGSPLFSTRMTMRRLNDVGHVAFSFFLFHRGMPARFEAQIDLHPFEEKLRLLKSARPQR